MVQTGGHFKKKGEEDINLPNKKMALNLDLNLNSVKDLTLPTETKNVVTNIGEAFTKAVRTGITNLKFPDNMGEIVKEGFEKIDLGEIGEKAAESALKVGASKLGINATTFNSLKDIFDAVKEGDLKKGLSAGLNVAINILKAPKVAKTILREGKDLILDQALGDELKKVMHKQQNTISRINSKCIQMEEAFKTNDTKTLDKVYKSLKSDMEKVMPIKNVLEKGNSMINRYELYKNKNGKALTNYELELCQKLI